MASEPQIFQQNSTLLGDDEATLPAPAATDSALQRFNAPPTTAYDKINPHSTPKSSTSVATQSQLPADHKAYAAIAALSPITLAQATAGGQQQTLVDTKADASAPLAKPEDPDEDTPSTPRIADQQLISHTATDAAHPATCPQSHTSDSPSHDTRGSQD